PLSELAKQAMTRVPQVLLNPSFRKRKALEEMPNTQRAIAQAQAALGQKGRVLVRWSGTEPKLRVMVEGENDVLIRSLAERIVDAASQDLQNLEELN
ncbi:MAG: phosphoglucosamine mutase, partial [Deltaproteobacteria bacterium]|nr:phosphoglucosamine mutase [Deltaproteobacteria bacterium]